MEDEKKAINLITGLTYRFTSKHSSIYYFQLLLVTFFEILSDLNQYTTGPSSSKMVLWCIRLMRLTFACEGIRYHLVEVRQNLNKRLFGSVASTRFSRSHSLSFSSSTNFFGTNSRALNSTCWNLPEISTASFSPNPSVTGNSIGHESSPPVMKAQIAKRVVSESAAPFI